ncbi:hypothetical protein HK098_008366, partial [Nowakowskiella sp. JEL0407]
YEYEHQGGLSPLLSASIQRQAITELAKLFQGQVSDVGIDSVIVELCAKPERIDAFLKLMKPFGIIEAARSGSMALPRSPIYENETEETASVESTVDATMLPPG